MSLRAALSRIATRPDLAVAVLAATFGLYRVADALPDRPPNPILIAILLASFGYIALRDRLDAIAPVPEHRARAACFASDIIFLAACAVALLSWHESLYVLPLQHFVAATVAAGTVVWDVASRRSGAGGVAAMMAKVLVLGLIVRGAAYFQYPGPIGSDPWQHVLITQTVAATGHLAPRLPDAFTSFNLYSSMPAFHVLTAALSQVAGVSAKTASFLGGSLPQVLSCLSIFLIGRSLRGPGAGVLAALLYCMADYTILWGVQVIAMTFASAIVSCVLWLLLSGHTASTRSAWVTLVLLGTLVLCHTVSAFVILVALLVVAVGLRALRVTGFRWLQEATTPLLTSRLVAAYGAFMLVWWMIMPTSSGDSFFAIQVEKLTMVMRAAAESEAASIPAAAPQRYLPAFLDAAGSAVLIGLGLFAALASFNPRGMRSRLIVLALAAGALVALRGLGSTSLQEALISARWVVFMYMVLAALSAWVAVQLLTRARRGVWRLGLAALLCAVYVFPMLTGSVANASSTFWPATKPRMGYTTSEQTAWRVAVEDMQAWPVSDGYYTGAMSTITSPAEYDVLSAVGTELFIERRNYLARPELNQSYRAVIGDMHDTHMGYYRLDGQPVFIAGYSAEMALTGGVVYVNDTTRMVQLSS